VPDEDSLHYKYLPTYSYSCKPATLTVNAFYYVFWFFIGQYILITLFLALILENFQVLAQVNEGEYH